MKMDEIMHYHCLIKEQNQEMVINELNEKRKSDTDIYITYLLTRAYNSIGKQEESLKIIETSKISKEKMLLLEANLDIENNEIKKAIKKLRKILNTTSNVEALLRMGTIESQRGNLKEAKYYYEKMLEINPEDFMALYAISSIEIRRKNYDEAEKIYFKILNLTKNMDLESERVKKNRMKKLALTSLMRLEIKKENYHKAYEYLAEIASLDFIVPNDINRENLYLKHKLGLLNKEKIDLETLTYFERQTINYSEETAIKHVSFHKEEAENKRKHSIFKEGTDFTELFKIVKEKIKNEEAQNFTISDNYVLIMDEILGTLNGVETNKLKVVTQINTKNIITMYLLPPHYEEINEVVKENEYKGFQRKRKSQIDKFNQKYGQIKM